MSTQQELFREFKLVRFQPDDIILVDKSSKKVYQYYELPSHAYLQPSIQHTYLQRPVVIGKALLYPKAYKTLETQLEIRKRAYEPIAFSEEEIVNTFMPILECLRQLHYSNIIHGNLDKKAVIIDQNGNIKLRDWLVKSKSTSYYSSQLGIAKSPKDDYKALALMILQCINLKMSQRQIMHNSLEKIVEPIVNSFSKLFILSIMVLMNNIENHYHEIGFCLGQRPKSDLQFENIRQLQLAYHKIKQAKIMSDTSKLEQSRKKCMGNSNSLIGNPSIQISPTKKFMISTNTAKKSVNNATIIKLEECQNRKTDQVKKKHIDKITKIIQRSNAFVNQLMSRRTIMDGKHAKGKLNLSLYSTTNNENNNLKRTSKQSIKGIGGSPSKRLRVVTKKK